MEVSFMEDRLKLPSSRVQVAEPVLVVVERVAVDEPTSKKEKRKYIKSGKYLEKSAKQIARKNRLKAEEQVQIAEPILTAVEPISVIAETVLVNESTPKKEKRKYQKSGNFKEKSAKQLARKNFVLKPTQDDLKVDVFESHPASKFESVLQKLNEMKAKDWTGKNRKDFDGKCTSFGMTIRGGCNKPEMKLLRECVNNQKYPELHKELFEIGKSICPRDFQFNCVFINKNVTCPKHKDKTNDGKSVLISIGDYTGAELIVEGVSYSTKYTPIMFNGKFVEHGNSPRLSGNKYSLVLYTKK